MEVIFNINSHHALNLGHQYDHNATHVTFEGFTPIDINNAVYLKFDGLGLIPLLDMGFIVSSNYVIESGVFKGQLVEVSTDNELIQHSAPFNMMVKPSLYASNEIYEEDPQMELWFTAMSELYQTVEHKLENGEFEGLSAYELAVLHGYEGTEEEWLEYLKSDITKENIIEALEYVPADEEDIPVVPENISSFVNDSKYLKIEDIQDDFDNKADISDVGDIDELITSEKSNVVAAINEIADEVIIPEGVGTSSQGIPQPTIDEHIKNIVGELSGLTTNSKSSIVNAINEINSKLDMLLK